MANCAFLGAEMQFPNDWRLDSLRNEAIWGIGLKGG
jgi:hypothetical protein